MTMLGGMHHHSHTTATITNGATAVATTATDIATDTTPIARRQWLCDECSPPVGPAGSAGNMQPTSERQAISDDGASTRGTARRKVGGTRARAAVRLRHAPIRRTTSCHGGTAEATQLQECPRWKMSMGTAPREGTGTFLGIAHRIWVRVGVYSDTQVNSDGSM